MVSRRRDVAAGFTLVELLVVVAVVGVLISLLLPAVQAARQAARRVSCSNNLRQIGVGLHGYHGVHKAFPPGCIEFRLNPGDLSKRQLAWSALLLPYIEQRPLFERIDFDQAFDGQANAEEAAEIVITYLCPSVARRSPRVDGRGACDYGGIAGERIGYPDRPPFPPRPNNPFDGKGTMFYNRAVRIKEVTDGTATTLIVSEDSGWKDGQWINGRNIFDQAFGINAAPPFENDIRSEHPRGANGLFCDGSARFLDEQMELRVLAAICTRAGREMVEEF